MKEKQRGSVNVVFMSGDLLTELTIYLSKLPFARWIVKVECNASHRCAARQVLFLGPCAVNISCDDTLLIQERGIRGSMYNPRAINGESVFPSNVQACDKHRVRVAVRRRRCFKSPRWVA